MAHAHIHILGSRAGYTTLDATPGVTTAERAELEVLSFGDATNAEAMARLETHASMIGRRLRSGRFAISRMLPGGTDDAGRPTIEVVSLLVDLASYTAILGALARLASDARLWRVARGAVSRGFEVPEEPVQITASDPRVLRAFDAWIAARKQGATAVLGAGDEPGLFAMVALLDTDDLAACRWGVGVLSLSAPVDVCTLAPTTAAIGPRPVLRASTAHAQPWLNAEMAAAEEHAARNPLLPPSASLAQAVRIEPAFDRPARATSAWDTAAASHEPQPRRRSLLPIAAVSAACSLALLAVMAVAYARGGRAVASGDFDRQSATSMESASAIEAPSAAPLQASGYSLIPEVAPPPPPVADRDGDGVADEVDECPDLAGGFLMDYYLDEDGDNLGSGEPVRLCTAPGGSTPAQPDGRQYASKNGDGCPNNRELPSPVDYYVDADGDGDGAGAPEAGCESLVKGKRDGHDGFWSITGGDQCDANPARKRRDPCGCDWPFEDGDEDRNETLDCLDDDDHDGCPNKDDKEDQRETALREVLGSKESRIGLECALALVEERVNDLQRIIDESRRRGGVAKAEYLANWQFFLETQVKEDIHLALRLVYDARMVADFGTVAFERQAAPRILEVATPAQFEVMEKLMEKMERVSAAFLQLDSMITGTKTGLRRLEEWREEIREYLRRSGPYEPRVGDWVLGFMSSTPSTRKREMDAIRGDISKSAPPKRQEWNPQ